MSFFIAKVAVTCNGLLVGLVSVTANCANVAPGSAIVIGCIGSVVLLCATELETAWRIDDPVGAFPVHGAGGMLGAQFSVTCSWTGFLSTCLDVCLTQIGIKSNSSLPQVYLKSNSSLTPV